MVPSIFGLSTQILNMKMGRLKIIIKSTSKRKMAVYDFGHRLHTQK